jgi:hypothetical protein
MAYEYMKTHTYSSFQMPLLSRDNTLGRLGLSAIIFILAFSAFFQSLSAQIPTGNGSGEFFPPISFPVAENPTDMTLVHLNDDEFIDVVIGTDASSLVQILLGNGDGSFDSTSIPTISIPEDVEEILTGNFDPDDNSDLLIVTDADNLYLLHGNGAGDLLNLELVYSQAEPIRAVSLADFNGDAQMDVVISSDCGFTGCPETRRLLSDGNGGLVLDPNVLPPSTVSMIEDIDADGDLDLCLDSGAELLVFQNDGNGNLSPLQAIPIDYEISELVLVDALIDNPDGLGNLDLICLIDDGAGLAFLTGFGDGTFGPPVKRYSDELDGVLEMSPAQLDGTGAPDLLLVSGSDEVLLVMEGHGLDGIPYKNFSSYPIHPDPACMKVEDFNQDGILDVMVASGSADVVTIFIGIEIQDDFRRGDVNGDNFINIADPVSILQALFVYGSSVITCTDASDVNDDGIQDLSDPIALLMFLFGSGAPLPAPFPDCGSDSTPDVLTCLFSLNPPCSDD